MKWAILSDVHANAKALRAVLAAVRSDGCGRIVSLGDVVGYGPSPAEAVALVRENCDASVMGNHDAAVCGRMWTDDFVERANDTASSHRQQLDADAVAWLKSRPYVFEGPGFACAHGDFAHPERFDYVSEAEDAVPSWNARPERLLFVGHTHNALVHVVGADGAPHRTVPQDFALEEGRRYVVNPGSVGWPRDGSRRASWAVYDDAKGTVSFRSIDLDALPTDGETPAAAAAARSVGRWLAWAAIAVVAGIGAFFACAGGSGDDAPETAEGAVPVASARPWGDAARTAKCTVPAGARKVAFAVALTKKSPPAFVRVVFQDANGADLAAGEKWWQAVKKSKKGSVPAPPGATAARVEACAQRAGQPVPEVSKIEIRRE